MKKKISKRKCMRNNNRILQLWGFILFDFYELKV